MLTPKKAHHGARSFRKPPGRALQVSAQSANDNIVSEEVIVSSPLEADLSPSGKSRRRPGIAAVSLKSRVSAADTLWCRTLSASAFSVPLKSRTVICFRRKSRRTVRLSQPLADCEGVSGRHPFPPFPKSSGPGVFRSPAPGPSPCPPSSDLCS